MATATRAKPDIADLLSRELGAANVIAAADDRLPDYGKDESGLPGYPLECAALCDTREHIEIVLRLAAEHGVPVTPRGAGSGKTGGALPLRGGVVLSTERMQRIIDIDERDLVVVTEPGVITGELQAQVEAAGLFYPPDPASLAYCSIGGNVAANAGGPRAFKYGVTREYVLGLQVALMGGEVLRCGRRTAKGVTGYDLVAGFVGSEGTFGVTSEITLRLLPKPRAVETLLAVFPDLNAAGDAVAAVLAAGYRPRTLEIADRVAIEHVQNKVRYRFPKDAGGVVWLELDGDPEGLEAALFRVGELLESQAALDVIVAQTDAERRSLWQARRMISPALTEGHRHKVSEDICVPRGALAEMLRRIQTIGDRFEFGMACFGHAGDGNLHVNFLIDDDISRPEIAARLDAAVRRLFEDTVELRGTLSGEHGIGLTKRDYMPIEQSARVLEWQRKWKAMWDPANLLNPGKILPARPRGCSE